MKITRQIKKNQAKIKKNQAKIANAIMTELNPYVMYVNPISTPAPRDWGGLQEQYVKHFRSGYMRDGNEEVLYTFFADMAINCNYYVGKKLLDVIKSYEKRMLNRFCKRDAQAYEIMIDSINLLSWYCSSLGSKYDNITEWAADEYRRLFYTAWKQYVSEEEMSEIWRNLD